MILAVSACLLGERIRYDGGHKHDRFITDQLGRYADLIPFCPEDPAFGTPRPTIRMVKTGDAIGVHSSKDDSDVTQQLYLSCTREAERIASHPLGGIILKSRSPSCGLGSTKYYLPNGMSEGKTDGLFAAMCRVRFPLLPIEEEGRLQDPWLRENFVMQIFAYDAFETLKNGSPAPRHLVEFHTRHKFLLQSKNETLYRKLGRIVANREKKPFEEVMQEYEIAFKTAIAHKSSIKKTRNVLEHLAGFFKYDLTGVEKRLLHTQIDDFCAKIIPLIVPLSTIALFAEKYAITYLLEQRFLEPYPKELALRSSIESGK